MEEKIKDQSISQERPVNDVAEGRILNHDEYRLAQLGYKQGECHIHLFLQFTCALFPALKVTMSANNNGKL